jgi:hypothetical protein
MPAKVRLAMRTTPRGILAHELLQSRMGRLCFDGSPAIEVKVIQTAICRAVRCAAGDARQEKISTQNMYFLHAIHDCPFVARASKVNIFAVLLGIITGMSPAANVAPRLLRLRWGKRYG